MSGESMLNHLSETKRRFVISTLTDLEEKDPAMQANVKIDYLDKIVMYNELMEEVEQEEYFKTKYVESATFILNALELLCARKLFIDRGLIKCVKNLQTDPENAEENIHRGIFLRKHYLQHMYSCVNALNMAFLTTCTDNPPEVRVDAVMEKTKQLIYKLIKDEDGEDDENSDSEKEDEGDENSDSEKEDEELEDDK